MDVRSVETRTLRGVIAIVDGLALWLLAIVLAAYAPGGPVSRTVGRLVPPVVEMLRHWWSTPGVGAFELLGFTGLGIAILGVSYLVATHPPVRTWLKDLGVVGISEWFRAGHLVGAVDPSTNTGTSAEDEETGFVFDSTRTRRGADSGAVNRAGLNGRRDAGSTDWAEDVLISGATDTDGPRGDFLRGGAAHRDDATPLAAEDDRAGSRGPDLLAAETVSDGGGEDGAALDDRVLEAFKGAATGTNEAVGDEVEEDSTTPSTESTDPEDVEGPDRVEPTERLAAIVADSRGKLARLENRLSMATADRSATQASAAVGEILDDTASLEGVERSIQPTRDVDLVDAVRDVRLGQQRIEDGVAAAISVP